MKKFLLSFILLVCSILVYGQNTKELGSYHSSAFNKEYLVTAQWNKAGNLYSIDIQVEDPWNKLRHAYITIRPKDLNTFRVYLNKLKNKYVTLANSIKAKKIQDQKLKKVSIESTLDFFLSWYDEDEVWHFASDATIAPTFGVKKSLPVMLCIGYGKDNEGDSDCNYCLGFGKVSDLQGLINILQPSNINKAKASK